MSQLNGHHRNDNIEELVAGAISSVALSPNYSDKQKNHVLNKSPQIFLSIYNNPDILLLYNGDPEQLVIKLAYNSQPQSK